KFKNLYRHWMENIKDWCISRQLWWGHRIPVYYLPDGSFVVAETEEKALELARLKTGNPSLPLSSLRQDEDVLDTWASSWLWPISVFEKEDPSDTRDLDYYYPTNDLVTAPEIIFFWVARMVIAGYEYKGTLPFKNVYFTGIVRDKLRRKMSKSLGNSPDPLDLIEKYGADGVRVGMLLCSPAGNDILFDESLTEQGRGFLTKVWNSFRLINGWEVDATIPQPEHSRLGIEWFRAKLNEAILTMDDHFEKYRLNDALLTIHATIRDEFSGWLLEIIKPAYQQPIDSKTYTEVIELLDKLLKLLHPFMPFISEEIWQLIGERKGDESIMMATWPKASAPNNELCERFELAKELISGIRSIRKEMGIAMKEEIELFIIPGEKGYVPEYNTTVSKLVNVAKPEISSAEVEGAATFMVKATAFYIPIVGNVDIDAEIAKINEDLFYFRGFLEGVDRKLGNEKFVASAPAAVVDHERKKKADAEEKIKILEDRLAAIK
ncbi:MAG: class I tRNA ligase family protein, partial [Prolixibacteraceae bacterium]